MGVIVAVLIVTVAVAVEPEVSVTLGGFAEPVTLRIGQGGLGTLTQTVKVTGPEKLKKLFSERVEVPEEPAARIIEMGFADNEKSGGGTVTVTAIWMEWTMEPLVPVTVTL